jgi:hypothetical protein
MPRGGKAACFFKGRPKRSQRDAAPIWPLTLEHDRLPLNRHCEERSDEAIQGGAPTTLDCFATLAMTVFRLKAIML